MTTDLRKLRADLTEKLASCDDPAFNADELIRRFLGVDRAHALLRPLFDAPDHELEALYDAVRRRAEGEPLQYILGEWDFLGRTFAVRGNVLIPRPETEALADTAIRYAQNTRARTVYDLCCGTGCIGISVAASCPEADVYLADVSPDALACARENAERLGAGNAHIVELDIFQGLPAELPRPDVIVCNPPYVPTGALGTLQREVQREPALALDGGADGLDFYRALCGKWLDALKEQGGFFFECAEDQAADIAAMVDRTRYGVRIEKDYCGVPRYVCGTRIK